MQTIVVIDDEPDICQSLAEVLSEEGYAVRCFSNGAEALEQLRSDARVSLILLDLMMPVMNGWSFREHQTRDVRLASIPVITMSATSNLGPSGPLRGVAMLYKPLDLSRLLARVRQHTLPA